MGDLDPRLVEFLGAGALTVIVVSQIVQVIKATKDLRNGKHGCEAERHISRHELREAELFQSIANTMSLQQEALTRLNHAMEASARESRDANARMLENMAIIMDRMNRNGARTVNGLSNL